MAGTKMRAVVSLANLMRRIGTVSATTAEMYEVMRRGAAIKAVKANGPEIHEPDDEFKALITEFRASTSADAFSSAENTGAAQASCAGRPCGDAGTKAGCSPAGCSCWPFGTAAWSEGWKSRPCTPEQFSFDIAERSNTSVIRH
tara:strand:+ start:638 stop:1069 length:432 start_codon:yes stop_codon:yes gene_type:complete